MEERQAKEILARAKINLYLNLEGRRPDGYHELQSLMLDLELADRIFVYGDDWRASEQGEALLSLSFFGKTLTFSMDEDAALAAGEPVIELSPESWSITRAIETYGAICDAWSIEPQLSFSHLHLRRSIPAGAGLGGASSDAAHLLHYLLDQHESFRSAGSAAGEETLVEALRPWLVSLGADVSFSYAPGPQLVSGLGELLEPVPSALSGYPVILVKPRAQCSTVEAFSRYGRALDDGDEFLLADERSFRAAYEARNLVAMDRISQNTFNALLPQDVQRELEELQRGLRALGAPYVQMTGSGPTLFAIFESPTTCDEAWQVLQFQELMKDCWLSRTTII